MNDHTEAIRTGRIDALTFEPMYRPTLHDIGLYRIRLVIVSNHVRFQCQEIIRQAAVTSFFNYMTHEAHDMKFQLQGADYVALRPSLPDVFLPALKLVASPATGSHEPPFVTPS